MDAYHLHRSLPGCSPTGRGRIRQNGDDSLSGAIEEFVFLDGCLRLLDNRATFGGLPLQIDRAHRGVPA